jgi:epoxyqueuosine reductase
MSASQLEPSTAELTAALRKAALRLGFTQVGICQAATPAGLSRLHEWLAAGYAGQMHYLPERAAAYAHPDRVLEGVRSLVMLAMDYRTAEPAQADPGQGRVSRYAWGAADYHDVIRERLNELTTGLKELAPEASVRGVVDTAPLLEREFAQLAGLGWVGKHTLLLNREHGSWFFLAALLTDLELENDPPHEADYCGSCRACLDACPTGAFPAPYVLDATRCISYLTIELRDHVPQDLREGMGDWLFGCDICQEVCPWNRRAPQSDEAAFAPQPEMDPMDLLALFELDDAAFKARFRHTPLWRARRRGLLRNAAIVLGNKPAPAAVEPLICGLSDAESLVRAACAWALGRYGDPRVAAALLARLPLETENHVRAEITAALGHQPTSLPATSPPATSPPATSPPATSPPATSPPATSPPSPPPSASHPLA